MKLHHRMRVASITKMMTYASVMELAKVGRVRLSDRAAGLAPHSLEGVPHGPEITVAQLLDHTSGLHNYNGARSTDFFAALFADTLRGTRRWVPEQLIAFAKKSTNPPTGRPGEKRSYSSTGYSVLELILENVSRKQLPDIYRQHLFQPLGMTSAGVEGRDFGTEAIVDSYARLGRGTRRGNSPFGSRLPARPDGLVNLSSGLAHYNAWAGAAGAVALNAEDLARFMDAVVSGDRTVLSAQEAEFSRARAKPGSTFSWNGGSWGIQASIVYEPSRDLTVIVLMNASDAGAGSHDVAMRLVREARL